MITVHEGSPTVDCTASIGPEGITILLSNHQVPLSPIEAEQVSITFKGLKGLRAASLQRIDETHANPKKAWMEMGSPTYLNREQIQALIKASELITETVDWLADEEGVAVKLQIQPHSAIAVTLVPAD